MIKDMTKGSISKHLITFSIPLILGNLFQLTYNAVDSIIVGRFAGTRALAAVGTSNPVMNIVILGVTGVCIGASVLMSEFFGAGKQKELKKEAATLLLFGVIFSSVIVLLGLLLTPAILRALDVPGEVLPDAILYLRIIFLGMPFTYLYNAMSSALRSVGDSKTPIRFLATASVLNACLDVVFVAFAHLGVLGAALATVIAEAFSGIMCLWYIWKRVPMLHLSAKELRIDRELLRKTLKQGSITALQQSCQPIGKLLIQGMINPLGVSATAAFNAVSRVDDFAFTPEQSISHGMMTFVAQNRGAKNKERVKKGLSTGLLVEFGYWVIICVVILLLREPIMHLFVSAENSQELVPLGVEYLGWMAFFYLWPAFTNGIQGFFRGMDNMTITLISTIIQISVRVIGVYFLVGQLGILSAAWASVLGWTCMLLAEVPYYFYYKKHQEILQ